MGGSLVFIIILSTLLFGAVEKWSIAVVGVVTALSFIYFSCRVKKDVFRYDGAARILISMLALLAYSLFQLIPFPISILDLVHHKLKDLLMLSPGITRGFHSISIYPFATETAVADLVMCSMVFTIAAFGLQGENHVRRTIQCLVVFGFVLGIFGIIQQATWNGKIYWFRELTVGGVPYGPFVNRNHFAGFIGMIIPLSLGIAFTERTMEKKVLFGFLGVVMATALFFSLSRGGITSFFAAMLLFSLFAVTRDRSKRKLVPVLFFIIIVAAYLLYLGISPIVERFTHADISNEQRLTAWKGTWDAFRDYPILGTGLGTFQYIFKAYQPEGLSLYWDHAHNDYLEALLELGIIGALFVVFFFFSVFKVLFNKEWEGQETYLGAAFSASIAAIAVHSIFDFNLHILSNALLFSLILGMAVRMSRAKAHLASF